MWRGQLPAAGPSSAVKRQHGTGRLYVKWGSYYGRWTTPDGRRVNRRVGKLVRIVGTDVYDLDHDGDGTGCD